MAMSAEARGYFRGQFRTRSGFKVSASFDRKPDGTWEIFSVGGVGVPLAFIPMQLALLPGQVFSSLDDAKWAVKSA